MQRIQLLDHPTGPAYRDFANPGALSTTSVKLIERRAGFEVADRERVGAAKSLLDRVEDYERRVRHLLEARIP